MRRAHAAGLRVSTHIDTAADFRHAVDAGVDEVNHLPQPDPRFSPDLSAYVIDAATARAWRRRRGIVVVTTASTTERLSAARCPAEWLPAMRANQRANFRTLREAGVAIAIGSDGISGERVFATARDEVRFIAANKLADNLLDPAHVVARGAAHDLPEAPARRAASPATRPASSCSAAIRSRTSGSCERIAMRVKQGLVLPPMGGPVILKRG